MDGSARADDRDGYGGVEPATPALSQRTLTDGNNVPMVPAEHVCVCVFNGL